MNDVVLLLKQFKEALTKFYIDNDISNVEFLRSNVDLSKIIEIMCNNFNDIVVKYNGLLMEYDIRYQTNDEFNPTIKVINELSGEPLVVFEIYNPSKNRLIDSALRVDEAINDHNYLVAILVILDKDIDSLRIYMNLKSEDMGFKRSAVRAIYHNTLIKHRDFKKFFRK